MTFQGHQDYIHSVALFNQSQQIASASEDGSVRLWGKSSLECNCKSSCTEHRYLKGEKYRGKSATFGNT